MILTEEDVRQIPERAKRELIRGEQARAQFAIFAQRQLCETVHSALPPARHMDGIGMKRTIIHPELAARIRVKYNTPGNIDCLHDPEFIRALLRDNPFLRCGSSAGKLTLRVDGLRDDPTRAPARDRNRNRSEEMPSTSTITSMSTSRTGNAGHVAQGDPAKPEGRNEAKCELRSANCEVNTAPAAQRYGPVMKQTGVSSLPA